MKFAGYARTKAIEDHVAAQLSGKTILAQLARFADPDGFGVAVVSTPQPGGKILVQTRYADLDAFGPAIVRPGPVNLSQARHVDPDVFGAGTAAAGAPGARTLNQTRFSDADGFGTGVVRGLSTLVQTRHADGDAFGVGTIAAAAPSTALPTGRSAAKPAGTLIANKTGQYVNMSGLWVFNEATGTTSPNLASPGTGNAVPQGAVATASDALGRHIVGTATYANYYATGLTGAQLGIGGASARTIFMRVNPSALQDQGGVFSYGTGASNQSLCLRSFDNRFLIDTGGELTLAQGVVARDAVATFVITYDGSLLKLHYNGAASGAGYVQGNFALNTGSDATFQIGRFQYGSNLLENKHAWHGKIYEVGVIAGQAWTAEQVAAYDAAPLAGMLSA